MTASAQATSVPQQSSAPNVQSRASHAAPSTSRQSQERSSAGSDAVDVFTPPEMDWLCRLGNHRFGNVEHARAIATAGGLIKTSKHCLNPTKYLTLLKHWTAGRRELSTDVVPVFPETWLGHAIAPGRLAASTRAELGEAVIDVVADKLLHGQWMAAPRPISLEQSGYMQASCAAQRKRIQSQWTNYTKEMVSTLLKELAAKMDALDCLSSQSFGDDAARGLTQALMSLQREAPVRQRLVDEGMAACSQERARRMFFVPRRFRMRVGKQAVLGAAAATEAHNGGSAAGVFTVPTDDDVMEALALLKPGVGPECCEEALIAIKQRLDVAFELRLRTLLAGSIGDSPVGGAKNQENHGDWNIEPVIDHGMLLLSLVALLGAVIPGGGLFSMGATATAVLRDYPIAIGTGLLCAHGLARAARGSQRPRAEITSQSGPQRWAQIGPARNCRNRRRTCRTSRISTMSTGRRWPDDARPKCEAISARGQRAASRHQALRLVAGSRLLSAHDPAIAKALERQLVAKQRLDFWGCRVAGLVAAAGQALVLLSTPLLPVGLGIPGVVVGFAVTVAALALRWAARHLRNQRYAFDPTALDHAVLMALSAQLQQAQCPQDLHVALTAVLCGMRNEAICDLAWLELFAHVRHVRERSHGDSEAELRRRINGSFRHSDQEQLRARLVQLVYGPVLAELLRLCSDPATDEDVLLYATMVGLRRASSPQDAEVLPVDVANVATSVRAFAALTSRGDRLRKLTQLASEVGVHPEASRRAVKHWVIDHPRGIATKTLVARRWLQTDTIVQETDPTAWQQKLGDRSPKHKAKTVYTLNLAAIAQALQPGSAQSGADRVADSYCKALAGALAAGATPYRARSRLLAADAALIAVIADDAAGGANQRSPAVCGEAQQSTKIDNATLCEPNCAEANASLSQYPQRVTQ